MQLQKMNKPEETPTSKVSDDSCWTSRQMPSIYPPPTEKKKKEEEEGEEEGGGKAACLDTEQISSDT